MLKAKQIETPNPAEDGPLFVLNWAEAGRFMSIDMQADGIMLYVAYGNHFTQKPTALPIGWFPYNTLGL